MQRIDNSGAVASLPEPLAAGTPGYFGRGNPGTGLLATPLSADWANMVQEELYAFLTAAGITPSKTTHNQVLAAVEALFFSLANDVASAAEVQAGTINTKVLTPLRLGDAYKGANQSLTVSGYQRLPGGLIVQWGTTASAATDVQTTVTFPIAFPNAYLNGHCTAILANPSNDNNGAIISATTTQITLVRVSQSGGGVSGALTYLAIGF